MGLGERKGEIFLKNGTKYALYNNDNDLPDSFISENERTVFGRNGFYPVIYSQHIAKNLLSALILGDPQREISMEGKEITFT